MQNPIFRRFKFSASLLAVGALAFFQPACANLPSAQRGALLVSADSLANIAGAAAATYYGGPAAGQLAGAGLSALGSVLQGYVGATIPTGIVQATPGIENVGQAVAAVIAPDHKVSQADVNAVNAAAKIAATLQLAAASGAGAATVP